MMKDFHLLIRTRLSAAVAATSLLGSFLAGSGWAQAFLATVGVFLLAGGASALNQVQERELDARMPRTRNRPVPAGRMRPGSALAISLVLVAAGLLQLAYAGPACALLGAGAVFLYNGVYTFWKPRTLFALLPGALAGALPPLIGWSAGGGGLGDPHILLPAGCLFLWQVPHFWLLARRSRQELSAAGLPVPDLLGTWRADRILAAWILALAFGSLSTLAAQPVPSVMGATAGVVLFVYFGTMALRLVLFPSFASVTLPARINAAMVSFTLLLAGLRWLV